MNFSRTHTTRLLIAISIIFISAKCTLIPAKSKQYNESFWMVIPGKSVGLINKNTSEDELCEIFGKENVTRSEHFVEDVKQAEITHVYSGKPDQLIIFWNKPFKPPIERIIIENKGAKWKTPNGITIGTTLEEVINLNEKDFSMYGFEWDYGGTTISWENGKLSELYTLGEKFAIRFDFEFDGSIFSEEASIVFGDHALKTNNEILRKLDVSVHSFAVFFN